MRAADRAVSGRLAHWSSGHGIVPARMPWVTAQESFHRQPGAAECPEFLDRLQSVVGARGIEAAARSQKRTHEALIKSDQGCDGAGHCSVTFCHSARRLARSSAPTASRARPRALTTRSTWGSSCWCSRNDSRMVRRIRLRSTELPAFFTDTASPRRGPPVSFGIAVTAKNPLPKRRPRAYAASKSDLRRRRRCAG
jgi:hypothetical protein